MRFLIISDSTSIVLVDFFRTAISNQSYFFSGVKNVFQLFQNPVVFMIEEDNRLIAETLNGKTESFGMLVKKYQNKMYNLAWQITHDSDISKDITQDTFIKAYRNLRKFDNNKKFFSWIYRITLNESLNNKKHSTVTEKLNEETGMGIYSPFEDVEKRETAGKIKEAINKLDDKYKSLILLKHYQELSYDEIAEILNIPPAKVKSRLYIARDILRVSLERMRNEK